MCSSTSSYRLKLKYGYQNGLLKQVSDYNAGSTVFWQATAMNPRFQVTQETLGNGIVRASGYDAVNGELLTQQAGIGGGSGVQNAAYQYDKLGNLTQRQNLSASLTETFTYDNLYRLDASKLNGTTNLDLSYNALGNITKRCEPSCGSTWTYHATKKHAVTQASVGSTSYSYTYDANGNATSRNGNTITWNQYNYPTQINGTGESVALSYDASFQRWKQVYTQGSSTETTIYVGGLLEKVTSGSTTDWRHSIYANGQRVAIVSRSSTGANATRYALEDHQNSIASFTDSSGGTIVGESFTAFGARRNPDTWSGAPSSSDLTTIDGISRDGYTGQTALGSLGLNHMNGRVQDAFSGRFLSADPYITEPGNTQGYNRYSYVNNNPLSFVDPSGFIVCPASKPDHIIVCGNSKPSPGPGSGFIHGFPGGGSSSSGRAPAGSDSGSDEPAMAEAIPEVVVKGTGRGGSYGYFDPSLLGEFGQYTFFEDTQINAVVVTGTRRRGGGSGGLLLPGWGYAHGALTAASFGPSVIGSGASLLDSALYALQGQWSDAGISFAAAGIGIVSDAGLAKVGLKAARGGGQVLYRYRQGYETATRLGRGAAEAETKIGIHGVSVTTNPVTGRACGAACRDAVEKYFSVVKTGADPNHYTAVLPKPVTKEVADQFNALFRDLP